MLFPSVDELTRRITGLEASLYHGRGGSSNTLTLKAGLLKISNGTAYPDPRRGKLTVEPSTSHTKSITLRYSLRPTDQELWKVEVQPYQLRAIYRRPPQYPRVLTLRDVQRDSREETESPLTSNSTFSSSSPPSSSPSLSSSLSSSSSSLAPPVLSTSSTLQDSQNGSQHQASHVSLSTSRSINSNTTSVFHIRHLWLQEVDPNDDEDIVRRLNEILHPPSQSEEPRPDLASLGLAYPTLDGLLLSELRGSSKHNLDVVNSAGYQDPIPPLAPLLPRQGIAQQPINKRRNPVSSESLSIETMTSSNEMQGNKDTSTGRGDVKVQRLASSAPTNTAINSNNTTTTATTTTTTDATTEATSNTSLLNNPNSSSITNDLDIVQLTTPSAPKKASRRRPSDELETEMLDYVETPLNPANQRSKDTIDPPTASLPSSISAPPISTPTSAQSSPSSSSLATTTLSSSSSSNSSSSLPPSSSPPTTTTTTTTSREDHTNESK